MREINNERAENNNHQLGFYHKKTKRCSQILAISNTAALMRMLII